MIRKIVYAGIVSVLFNGWLTLVGRGSLLHDLVVMVVVSLIGVPALVVASAYWGSARRLARTLLLVAAVSVSTLSSLVTGEEFAKRDLAATKTYCESVGLRLEEYKRAHGAYPRDLSMFPRDLEAPSDLEYSSDGSEFRLSFHDPRRFLYWYHYTSKTHGWFLQH